MHFLYTLVASTAMLALSPYFLIRGLRHRKYIQNLPERLGLRFPPELRGAPQKASGSAGTVWIHAVSVGEALAAVPLARAVKERFADRRLVISTTTATGQALARERMKFADAIFYFPLDWPGPVQRTLRRVRPDAVIIFETEIWPNFLRVMRRAGVPVAFVNGRLSAGSFRGFSRAVRWSGGLLGGFMRDILNDAAMYLMQSEEDAERLMALGAESKRVLVAGNMKYDMAPPLAGALVDWLAAEIERSQRRPVLVAGSVLAGEEAAVLGAFAEVTRKYANALLILAPRKPERFEAASHVVGQAGRRVIRRSSIQSENGALKAPGILTCEPGEPASVLMLDTIGELAALYQLGDAVFIGGSLVPLGGHNPLEPAAFGKVPLFGPSMENFHDIAGRLLGAGAAIQVQSAAELGAAWLSLLADSERRDRMGQAARDVVEQNRGATAAVLAHVAVLLSEPPSSRRPQGSR